MSDAADPGTLAMESLVGRWTTEATHPSMPGVVVRGSISVEWLEGRKFLIHRGRTDNEAFPDSISILGCTDEDRVRDDDGKQGAAVARLLHMQYFDSRGVFRVYETSVDNLAWRYWRDAPGFSQRFTGTFAEDGNVIVGRSQVSEDDVTWKDDLAITYRRA